jgi:hypothetical protein
MNVYVSYKILKTLQHYNLLATIWRIGVSLHLKVQNVRFDHCIMTQKNYFSMALKWGIILTVVILWGLY